MSSSCLSCVFFFLDVRMRVPTCFFFPDFSSFEPPKKRNGERNGTNCWGTWGCARYGWEPSKASGASHRRAPCDKAGFKAIVLSKLQGAKH